MDLLTLVLFCLGLVLLVGGAEILVRGASALAAAVGVSPLVIGLTVVAFGTSSPELMVSVQSSLSGDASIALGNIVGSNIFNILLILGLSATIVPLVVDQQLIRLDVPLMIGLSALLWFFTSNGQVGRAEGLILTALLLVYVAFTIWQSRKAQAAIRAEYEEAFGVSTAVQHQWLLNIALVAAGLAALAVGSRWLVSGATEIARSLGVSEFIIGVTVVAAGTSLPEVATSVMASIRGERDIAVGNAVGSNIFNILAVLGVAAAVAPNGVIVPPAALAFDIPVMVAVAVVCLPIFFTGSRLDRWEGFLFLGYYVAYTIVLILTATQRTALEIFNPIMLYLVVPVTLLVLGISLLRSFRNPEQSTG